MDLLSLFSDCGVLDIGFARAEFNITVSNEYDPVICEMYKANQHKTKLLEGYMRIIWRSSFQVI